MAATSAQVVRNRIEAICATVPIPGSAPVAYVKVLNGTEPEITEDMLPAIRVLTRSAEREATSRDKHLVTRTYRILLYVKLIPKHENQLYEQQPDVDAAEAWLDIIPDFFFRYANRLELNNAALTGVWSTGEMSGDEPAIAQWITNTYTAIPHDFPVTTERSKS